MRGCQGRASYCRGISGTGSKLINQNRATTNCVTHTQEDLKFEDLSLIGMRRQKNPPSREESRSVPILVDVIKDD
jgi:hypothetical protein